MTSRDEMVKLRERVRAAKGSDNDLAVEVSEALNIASYVDDADDFTRSIDAALGLCERVLPGWSYQIIRQHPESGSFSIARVNKVEVADGSVIGFDAVNDHTPLAILDALLSALIQKDTSHVGS